MRNFTNLSERSHFVTAPDLNIITGAITTSNSFSQSLYMAPGIGSVATYGSWTGSFTIQLSGDNATWFDVESFTANLAKTITVGFKSYFRVGFKAAAYTGGTVNYILGQGY
jgi:hypothetical protein